MEPTEKFKNKLESFEKAVRNFEDSLSIDINDFSEVEIDAIKSGQIQKFEFCTELCWKIIKSFLNDKHGIVVNSPKSSIREFYNLGLVREEEYETLIGMLEDRNRLSHIYEEMLFDEVYEKLREYLDSFKLVLKKIKK